ncbi:ABC transporter ATP-binding protein [Chachezhania sediminis]|uniref:ABC transporter ATP-binding protein n=1 Tax=Chachezhania sediminis TaxID=2599291 RepID=UPI00131D29C2|nr:ABC transporter ATP-binding protein [Chachezhania sediminis]
MLELIEAQVSYGKAIALHDVSLAVAPSQVVALVGRNGAGKSTTLKAMMGVLPLDRGRRRLFGEDVTNRSVDALSRMGVAYVPENRQVFSGLTAEENLDVAALSHAPGPWTRQRVYDLFPRLHERRTAQGTSLSGGEQQMLVIGRALMTNPRMLLLDEPTEGLAPVIVDQIVDAVREIAASGTGIVLVEQNFQVPRRVAHSFALIDSGRFTWQGGADQITHDLETLLAGFAAH